MLGTLLRADGGTDIWSVLASSPVLVALVSIFLVKLADILNERWKIIGSTKKDVQTELWKRIEQLEAERRAQEAKNDVQVAENAKLGARISLLEAQNASQLQQVLDSKKERDEFKRKFEESDEMLHRTMLQLREAQIRIKQLEDYIVVIKQQKRATREDTE